MRPKKISRTENNEELLKHINKYFTEDNKDFSEISYDQLMWYLSTLFVWHEELQYEYKLLRTGIVKMF